MAFLSKLGGILKQTAGKQIEFSSTRSTPSILQAVRWMSSSKVFIGGLSYSTDDTGLREAFAQYGNVVDARVIVDRESGRSRGFGFITYTSSEEANSAIQALDGQDLHGRRVRVAYATDRARPSGYGGGGYGDGGYGGSGAYQGGNYGDGGYGSGGYGGSGSGTQGGVDGYGSGGANYGGGYGGGSFRSGGYTAGGSPGGYTAGGSPGGYTAGGSNASYGDGVNLGVSGGAGGNATADTSFAVSGLQEGSGLGKDGASDQFGIDTASDFEPKEQLDRDEDEDDDFAKRV